MNKFIKWIGKGFYQFLLGIMLGAMYMAFMVGRVEAQEPYFHSCEYKDKQSNHSALACNIYFESRSEGIVGMLAVGNVTLNRFETDRYPNNVVDVVYQASQFSWTNDGLSDRVYDAVSWRKALRLSEYLLGLKTKDRWITDVTTGSIYYHTLKISPYWASKDNQVVVIGNHIFYKNDLKR